jgi:hypothetical protein
MRRDAPQRRSTATRHPQPCSTESGKRDSNPRPQPWQGCALPTELFPQCDATRLESRQAEIVNRSLMILITGSLSRHTSEHLRRGVPHAVLPRHGGEGNRTPDLLNAIQALSQLSYAPSSQSRAVGLKRRSPGTTKYSRGYTECQRIGTGENLIGRYFAAPFVTHVGS